MISAEYLHECVIDRIDQYLTETHEQAIASLCEVLRIAGISTQPDHAQDVRASAQWTCDYLAKIGLRSQIWQTAGLPAVFAEWSHAPSGAPTILIYGHHDVQPTGDLEKWTSPPFEPRIDSTGRIFARGSADDKGQFFLQVRAVESWLRMAGSLPINVKFLIEGEEEIGSPNLAGLLEQRKSQ